MQTQKKARTICWNSDRGVKKSYTLGKTLQSSKLIYVILKFANQFEEGSNRNRSIYIFSYSQCRSKDESALFQNCRVTVGGDCHGGLVSNNQTDMLTKHASSQY